MVTTRDSPKMRNTTVRSPLDQPRRASPLPSVAQAQTPDSTLDVHPVIAGYAGQTRGVALTDGTKLPFGAGPVKLAEYHCGLRRGILREVIAGELAAIGTVDDPNVGVLYLAE